jgi:hypothetical protein
MKTAEEIEREVEAMLDDELANRRRALREELAARERRKAFNAHMDKINAPHPVELPPTPEEQAELDRWNAESRQRDAERRAAAEKRWAEDEARRVAAEVKSPLPRMRVPGSEGFTIKRVV